MFQFSSIRTKLYSLVPATLLAMGVAVGIGLYVQHRYAIGGPIDARMAAREDFLSEVEPAVFVPTLGYIALLELETERRPAEVVRLVQQFRTAEAQFRTAREKRLPDLSEGEIRRLVERDLTEKVGEFFTLANTRYIPLVERSARGEPADAAEIARVRREIGARFQDVKRLTDRLVTLTRDDLGAERAAAAESVRFWGATNVVVSLVAVASLVLTKYLIARSIVRASGVLTDRVRELASGAT
ncbi:MAG: hypothetical protein C0501_25350, partial [Isosphaera sp.]|nr:hypothetical protein [Isosphaera sp.]